MSTATIAAERADDVLSVRNVSAAYGPYRALFDVSFRVPERGIVALVGSNGAGKSTVARTVTGLVTASTGQVVFSGQDVTTLPAYKIARLGMAHVVEGRGVFSTLTVEENLTLAFRQRAGRGKLKDNLERAYTAFPILGERRRQVGGTLSGGQQRLLSLAKVLVVPSKVLVADELSLGLAPVVVDTVYEGLREINGNGTALVVVEQQINRALQLANWAVVLEHGSVAYEGEPAGAGKAVEALMERREKAAASGAARVGRVRHGPGRDQLEQSGRRAVRGGNHMREPVIVDVVRTAFGKRGGALANWHPADLLAFSLTGLLERTGLDPERVDDVIAGCVSQVGEQSTNIARNGWVSAGLPQRVPATTVDRQCGSSQQAVHFAAAGVAAGHYDLVVACGVEVMSRVPLASNARGGTGPFPPSFMDAVDGRLWTQFRVSQVLADRYGITREEMDAYALESHRRAAESWDSGHFEREALAVPIKAEDGSLTGEFLRADEGIRRTTTAEALAALPPAQHWEPDTAPDITAGNSSQTTDGAAAMLIAERSVAEALGLPVRARFAHFAVAADDAAIVLSAPVPVTHKLLERSGMKVDEFDAVECNEAFAAIALMWQKAFSYDLERFNPRGGAIAIGHPLGASGVRLMGTLLNQLEATGGRYGYQTMCEGGGQANGTVIERLG